MTPTTPRTTLKFFHAALFATLLLLYPAAAQQTANRLPEPATAEASTVEQATRVLDLRTFPRMKDAEVNHTLSLAMLMYSAQGAPKEAFEFQRKELTNRGFKELPGGYYSDNTNSSHFTKDGFVVAASTSEAFGDPQKKGWSQITLVNSGNVPLDKLPVPPGVKPFHPTPREASYTTSAAPLETAAACRKLLLEAGWEPYGKAGATGSPDSSMEYFKCNAIKLQSWIMTTPAEGGKTLIRYSTDLLSADLPAPPFATDPRFDDWQKKLWFELPATQTDAILAFYQERLPKQGWQATTERPIVDDRKNTRFLIFRNPQKDMLSLDLSSYSGKVATTLKHQTAAEVAEEERKADAAAERARQELAAKNATVNVAVPLPANAKKLTKKSATELEFSLPTGSGAAALEMLRTHFLKEGWTEDKGRDFGNTSGSTRFEKGYARLNLSYFDLGLTEVDITISGTKNVVLQPGSSTTQLTAEAPPAGESAPTARQPAIPGLPALPPGIELPADVKNLLNKALEEAGKKSPSKKPAPPKSPSKK